MRRLVLMMALLAGCGDAWKMDADGDGVGEGFDCDDHDARVWRSLSGYKDGDGDSHGGNMAVTVCYGETLPPGIVATSDDCDDDDASSFQLIQGFVDEDHDGIGAGAQQQRCVGAASTLVSS